MGTQLLVCSCGYALGNARFCCLGFVLDAFSRGKRDDKGARCKMYWFARHATILVDSAQRRLNGGPPLKHTWSLLALCFGWGGTDPFYLFHEKEQRFNISLKTAGSCCPCITSRFLWESCDNRARDITTTTPAELQHRQPFDT